MSKNQKSNPIPVRYDESEIKALQEISEQTGFPQAQIIRLAVKVFIREVQRTKTIPTEMNFSKSSEAKSKGDRSEGDPPKKAA